jgi:hypothetical protein
MKRFFPYFASALVWLAVGLSAKADPTPAPNAQWTYQFTINNPNNQVIADPRVGGGQPGGVNLTDEPQRQATGSSVVDVTNITTFSTAPATSPDNFGANTGTWNATLTLKDNASGASTTLNLTGKFNGKFAGGTLVNGVLQGGFSNIGADITPQTTTVTLGNYNYTFSFLIPDPKTGILAQHYTPPGPPGANNQGSIAAYISVTSGNGHIASVPEPSTMLLAGFGLSLGGLVAWRKRRQRAALAMAA